MPFLAKKAKAVAGDSLENLSDSVKDLAAYTEDEFSAVASAMQSTEPDTIWNSAPPKPRRGTYAYADGTNWNPAYGEGPYAYNGSLWVPMRGDLLWNTTLSLTAAQQAQIRTNTALGKWNKIINGGMQISQQNGTTAVASGAYPVDQFFTSSSTSGTFTAAQVASVTPGGSPNRLRITVTAADAAVAATDYAEVVTRIEGFRVADLGFGASGAKQITLRFGIRGPAGTYSIVATNSSGAGRVYTADYTISGGEANTDLVRSITIPGDTTGTWTKDNTIGLQINWALMAGTTMAQAPGSWQAPAGAIAGSTNQFNFMGTNGNVFELFDVTLVDGATALPFQLPDFASEILLCKRYWQKSYNYATALGTADRTGCDFLYQTGFAAATLSAGHNVRLTPIMRNVPTITMYSPGTGASGKIRDDASGGDATPTVDYIGQENFRWYASSVIAVTSINYNAHWAADARM